MAYRTFRNEATYAAPQIEGLPQTVRMAQMIAMDNRRQRDRKRELLDNYNIANEQGSFPSTQKRLNEGVSFLINKLNDHKIKGGLSVPYEVRQGQSVLASTANRDKTLMDMFKATERAIESKRIDDPDYDPTYDRDLLMESMANDNTQDDIENIISKVKPGENPLKSFRIDGATDRYVANKKTEKRSTDRTLKDGSKIKNSVEAVFLDDNGNPKVTEEAAIDYLANPNISKWYQASLNQQLLDEANKLRSEKSGEKLKSMSDEEAVSYLREHPEENTINSTPPGIRERDMAIKKLEARQRVMLDNSSDYSGKSSEAGRGITSKKYGLSSTFDTNSYGGAGGTFVNKQTGIGGMSIPIRGTVFNKGTKQLSGSPSSEREMFATVYNYLPIDKNGVPFDMMAKSPEEQVKIIENMTPEQVRDMDLKTVVQGQSWNKADLSRARINLKKSELNSNKTEDELATENDLREALRMAEVDPDLHPEIIQAKLGITVDDVIKVVEPNDVTEGQIKSKLGEFKLTDTKNETPEMRMVREAWGKKKIAIEPILKQQAEEKKKKFAEKSKIYQENVKKLESDKKDKPSPPEVGSVVDGYQFLGGDPAQQKSWKKM
jgi:hypothetical protein